MKVEDIKQYCLEKHKADETYPFGDVPICYKLNGKSNQLNTIID